MRTDSLTGRVALVTGAANGIGAGTATRLSSLGARVVLVDVDDDAGAALARRIDGHYVNCDVRDLDQNLAAVAETLDRFGRLDVAHLNAGVSSGCGIGDDFDLERYRRAMGVNLDGVAFGIHAVRPAMVQSGGGTIVTTASLAGLLAVPPEPFYSANKHAVVGLVRSVGPVLAAEGIVVNALCPGFVDTELVLDVAAYVEELGAPLLAVDEVVDAFVHVLGSDDVGQCWLVQPGRPPEPFAFRNVPGPRRTP
jgi:NAD(P)-dependent dehydrogenase (short-subunit alcohol dehydrogenase family)